MKPLTFLVTSVLVLSDLSKGFTPSYPCLSWSRSPTAPLSTTRYKTVHNMFTGIVEEMGTVVSLEDREDMTLWDGSKGKGTELTVRGKVVLDGAYLG